MELPAEFIGHEDLAAQQETEGSDDQTTEEGEAEDASGVFRQASASESVDRVFGHKCRAKKCAAGCPGAAGKRWAIIISQTADYVTNLALPNTLTPNNASVRQNDFQFQTLLNGQYRLFGNTRRNLTTGYTFYQALHPEVKQVDLLSHAALTRYTHAFTDKVIGALDYEYSYFYLQGVPFVSRNRLGVRLLTSPTTRGDWQLGYDVSSNDFRIDPTQTAVANSIRLERIRYVRDDRTSYLTYGAAYGRNSAVLNSWTYDVYNLFAAGTWTFGCQKKNQLIVLGSYGHYAFEGPDVIETTVLRRDDIWTASGRLSRNLTDRFSIFAQYVYFNSGSNIVRQRYDSNLSSVGAQVVW